MITLALDEFGRFEEEVSWGDTPLAIAGILYDDKGISQETEREKQRVEAFYSACISLAKEKATSDSAEEFIYPNALHSNGDRVRDAAVVKPVKKTVNRALGEFIKKGTFEGRELLINEERRGEYYIFANMKSNRGVYALLGDNVNYFANDDKASNLYFHMASEVICRVIFHNPLLRDIRDISLCIATRRTANFDRYSEQSNEYLQQGYHAQLADNNQVFYSIANADVYRSIISREILHNNREQMRFHNFEVKPIQYVPNRDNMEFLYLADTICSYISHNITMDENEEWVNKILQKADSINSKERNLIFAYDAVDFVYQQAWNQYENGNYFEALAFCHKAQQKTSVVAKYYAHKWFAGIRDYIEKSNNEACFVQAVHKARTFSQSNSFESAELLYIVGVLMNMAPNVISEIDDVDGRLIAYDLYDTAISIYGHFGDYKKVIECYEKLKPFKRYVGLDRLIATNNKLSGAMLDNCDYDAALKIADQSIGYHKSLKTIMSSIIEADSENIDYGLAKAISQKAQVLSFMRNTDSEGLFLAALDMFEPNSANYRITQSYLMHYYIDQGMETEYKKQAIEYFGGQDKLRKQLEYILDEAFSPSPMVHYKYALYLFLKGIYCFCKDEISDSLYSKLLQIESELGKRYRRAHGRKVEYSGLQSHPTEMIYKYLALIAQARNDMENAEIITKKLNSCIVNADGILKRILEQSNQQIQQGTGITADNDLPYMYN